jgi:hypothetical protein
MKLAQHLALGFCYHILNYFIDHGLLGCDDYHQLAAAIFRIEYTFTLKIAAGTYLYTQGC